MATINSLADSPTMPPPVAAVSAPIDPMQFVREHRIHIDGGSLFNISEGLNGYLVVHPAELAPENEDKLRKKLRLTLKLNDPSFFEIPGRGEIAQNLGRLIGAPLQAEHTKLVREIEGYNARVQIGGDIAPIQEIVDKHAPMSAVMRENDEKSGQEPLDAANKKNGLVLYELMRAKLAQNGYHDAPEAHVRNRESPDQILGDLEVHLGISPLQIREAAAEGGVAAVGALLGLDPRFVNQMVAMAEDASRHEFSNNRIDSWLAGIETVGMDAPLKQKLSAGLQTRVDTVISNLRGDCKGVYETPKPIQEREAKVAEMLKRLPPDLVQAMYQLGFEICYTPEFMANKIAHFNNIFGLNRKTSDNPNDVRGTYRIFFSSHETFENRVATLVHEAHHVFWPNLFTHAQAQAIDQLLERDSTHIAAWYSLVNDPRRDASGYTAFDYLKALCAEYQAPNATDASRAAVIAKGNALFAARGVTVDGVLPNVKSPERFQLMLDDANRDLRIEGARYQQDIYSDAPSRLREMISRFAELKYVRLRDDPAMLKAVAPGMCEVHERYYLPHLKLLLQKLNQGKIGDAANDNHRSVAADAALPREASMNDPLSTTEKPTTETPAPTKKPATALEEAQPIIVVAAPKPAEPPKETAPHADNCPGCASCMGAAPPSAKIAASSAQSYGTVDAQRQVAVQ